MAIDLDTRVTQLSGSIIVDSNTLHQWYVDASIDIINRLKVINPAELNNFGTTTYDITDASGVVVFDYGGLGGIDLLYVSRNGYICTKIPVTMKQKAADPNSIYYATKKHPVYYVENSRVYVLPTPTSSETASVVVLDTPDYLPVSSTEDIQNVPDKFNYLIVLYAAMQNALSHISNISIQSDITVPSVPVFDGLSTTSQSLPTMETVDRLVLPVSPDITDIDFSEVDYTPVFVHPVAISLPTLSLGDDLTIASFTQTTIAPTPPSITIGDGTVAEFDTPPTFNPPVLTLSDAPSPTNITLPSSPSIDSYITVTESLPTWTVVSAPTLPTAPADADIDFSSIPSTPSFSPPSLLVLPAVPDIDINVTKSLSSIASIGDITLPALTLPESPTIPALSVTATVPTTPSDPNYTDYGVINISHSLPTYNAPTPPTSFSTLMSSTDTYIDTDEDIELATAKLNQLKEDIDAYISDIKKELDRCNTSIMSYKAEIDYGIADSSRQLTYEDKEYLAKLSKFSTDISRYQAEINEQVAEYVNTYLNGTLKVWEIQTQAAIAEYQAKAGAEIQKYVAESKAGTAEVEALIYSTELQKESATNTLKLQKYSDVVAAKINEYKAELDKAVNEYTASFKNWETEITKAISTYQVETGYDLSKYSAEVQAVLGEHSANLNNMVQEFRAGLDKYITDLQYVNTNNDRVLNKYLADINKYNIEVNSTLQKWSLENIQSAQTNWITQRQTDISKFQLDIQNALNEFNEANTQYQADIQKKILEATNSMTSDIETVRAELNKYSEQLAQYQIDVNTELQEYLQKDVQTALSKWVEKRRNLLDEFRIKSDNAINKYNSELNEAINKYQLDIQVWAKQIDKALNDYSIKTGLNVDVYKTEVQAIISKHTEDINNVAATFNAELSKYTAEINKIDAENKNKLAEYAADIQLFNGRVNAEVSKMQLNLQKVNIEQAKYTELYRSLRTQYEQGFLPFQIRNDRGYQSINPIL